MNWLNAAICLLLACLGWMIGNWPGSLGMVISVAKTCSIIWCSYAMVLFNLVASALMALCFLSQAKQLGSWPYLARESGKRSIQCHFESCQQMEMLCGKWPKTLLLMWRREALDVAPQQTPAKSLTMAHSSKFGTKVLAHSCHTRAVWSYGGELLQMVHLLGSPPKSRTGSWLYHKWNKNLNPAWEFL